MNTSIIFVYGTLKTGYGNHRLLLDSNYMGEGKIIGYDLYDLGSFPGIIGGTGEVLGEIYEIDQYTLKKVDMLEAEGFLYSRVPVEVFQNEKIIKADAYVFKRSLNNARRIEREWRNNYD